MGRRAARLQHRWDAGQRWGRCCKRHRRTATSGLTSSWQKRGERWRAGETGAGRGTADHPMQHRRRRLENVQLVAADTSGNTPTGIGDRHRWGWTGVQAQRCHRRQRTGVPPSERAAVRKPPAGAGAQSPTGVGDRQRWGWTGVHAQRCHRRQRTGVPPSERTAVRKSPAEAGAQLAAVAVAADWLSSSIACSSARLTVMSCQARLTVIY